jgi:hypothetical protein
MTDPGLEQNEPCGGMAASLKGTTTFRSGPESIGLCITSSPPTVASGSWPFGGEGLDGVAGLPPSPVHERRIAPKTAPNAATAVSFDTQGIGRER